ncbi:alanine racemase [Candidatus Dependentiae bacterium]|nr:alanine racemase [Candidatus Dependentiae bacterium]
MSNEYAVTDQVTRLEINLDELGKNYHRLKNAVAPARVMAVVKDNGYGHGLTRIAQKLYNEGCELFACATLNEAFMLKKYCSAGMEILILRALTDTELKIAVKNNFQITINSLRTLEILAEISDGLNQNVDVHLKIDTGLGRLGFFPEEVLLVFENVRKLKNIRIKSIFSHFAVSYQKHEFTLRQLALFKKTSDFAKKIFPDIICHIAATAGTICIPDSRMDMVRVSSLLYGLSYSQEWPWGIKPVLKWIAPIIQVRTFPEGWNIGYKLLYSTSEGQRIGVLSVGAGDSYPYSLRLKSDVLIRGKRCKVVGMSLDQIMVDLTNVPEACEGEEAVLIGIDGNEHIRSEELGVIAGTSAAEILSRIPSRIPRYYFENGKIVYMDDCCSN